tara:strand:- start:1147 stop:1884 length:738 start_codon:yes stop_codon:yes gene_type:complete
MKKLKKTFRRGERGNVLFLILIAVALFAALSYAVTSSSRSGGGDANDESALVRSAQITQYPSSVRTSMIRMMVSNSIDPTDMIFAGPSDFSTACDDVNVERPNCVFHPLGGAATLTNIPADLMVGTVAGEWVFSANYEIVDIGTSDTAASDAGNDIIAFLPGITNGLCARINEELGISGNTTDAGTDWDLTDTSEYMDDAAYWATVSTETDIIGDGATAGLAGQAFGCLTDSAGENIYYHALLER